MSKERLEELEGKILGNISFKANIDDLLWVFDYAKEQVGRVEKLDKNTQDLREALGRRQKQNKLYHQTLKLLNAVASNDLKESIDTNSHFIVDVTSEVLEGELDE